MDTRTAQPQCVVPVHILNRGCCLPVLVPASCIFLPALLFSLFLSFYSSTSPSLSSHHLSGGFFLFFLLCTRQMSQAANATSLSLSPSLVLSVFFFFCGVCSWQIIRAHSSSNST